MIKHSKTAAAFIISSAVILGASSGCSTNNKEKLPASRTHSVAEDGFSAGAGRAPTAATSHSFAKILVSQGRDRDALYVLQRIVRDHPKFIPAYNEMASIYVRADRIDDAVASIQSGLKLAPNDSVLHNNLGMCHLLDGEYDQALADFTHAADLMPNNPTFRSNRAAALALLGRRPEAETEYRTVLGKTAVKQNLTILDRARANNNVEPEIKETAAPTVNPPNAIHDAGASAEPVENGFEPDGDATMTAELPHDGFVDLPLENSVDIEVPDNSTAAVDNGFEPEVEVPMVAEVPQETVADQALDASSDTEVAEEADLSAVDAPDEADVPAAEITEETSAVTPDAPAVAEVKPTTRPAVTPDEAAVEISQEPDANESTVIDEAQLIEDVDLDIDTESTGS